MRICVTINEEKKAFPDGISVLDMLLECVGKTKGIAVLVNEEIVKKTTYESRMLTDGDQVEILTFAGGG